MAGITTQARMDAFKAGEVRYNDGNRCLHGHDSDRYTKTGECCECNAMRSAARRKTGRPPAAPSPTVTDHEVSEVSLSQQWQYVEPGVYATAYNGHTLQTRRNPDREDKRRYISIVDRVPIDTPSWSLSEAKTKAIKAVQRAAAGKVFDRRPTAQAAQPYPVDAPQPAPDYSPSDQIDSLFADLPHPDLAADQLHANSEAVPEPAPGSIEQSAPVEVRAPEPAQAVAVLIEQPGAIETARRGDDTMRAVFTVDIAGHDMVAALHALQSAADLLRSLGHVDCTVDLPPRIRL
jgi:hypothetical protein